MSDRHHTDQVPSPGGWEVPAGERGGRTWVPPAFGATPAPERMPWWVRIWNRVPFVDRYAHQWMWDHGGFLVLPPDHPFGARYGPDEYEALTGMPKVEYERQCLACAREAFLRDGDGPIADADVQLDDGGLDTALVVRFRVEGRPGARFASRVPLWPSPHPDDYEGTPDWSDMLPSLLTASITSPYVDRLAGEPDAEGVTWV